MVWNGKAYIGIESPVEQNRRHISLLEKKLTLWGNIMPTRLGIPMAATFHNYVLVAANSRIDRPSSTTFNTSMVIKADALVEAISKRVDGMGMVETFASAAKMISGETLETFARSLIKLHRPTKIDYASKLGISVKKEKSKAVSKPIGNKLSDNSDKNKHICEKCGAEVDSKVVNYCRFNKEKFGGKTLCKSCQQTVSTSMENDNKPAASLGDAIENSSTNKQGKCEGCGVAVDSKVLYFCRLNKKKYGGKILCRDCQARTN